MVIIEYVSAKLCSEAIKEAIKNHVIPEILNTDQGSQITNEVFINALIDNVIRISMDGKGRTFDNIFIVWLWRSIKYENVHVSVYENCLSLWKGLASAIFQ